MFQTVINGRPVCLALSGLLDAEFTKWVHFAASFIPEAFKNHEGTEHSLWDS